MQIPIIFAGIKGFLDRVPADRIVEWEESFRKQISTDDSLLSEIAKAGGLTKELEEKLSKTVTDHVDGFLSG